MSKQDELKIEHEASNFNRRRFLGMAATGAAGATLLSSVPFASSAIAQEGQGPFIESISGGAVVEGSVVEIRGSNLGGGNPEGLCIIARGEDNSGPGVTLRTLEGSDEVVFAEVGPIPPELAGQEFRVQVGVGEGRFVDGREIEVNGFEVLAPVHLTSIPIGSVALSNEVLVLAESSQGDFTPVTFNNNNELNFGLGGDWFAGTVIEFDFHLEVDTNGDGVADDFCDTSIQEVHITKDMSTNECALKIASMIATAFQNDEWSSIQVNVIGDNIQVTTDPSSGHTIVGNFSTFIRFQ